MDRSGMERRRTILIADDIVTAGFVEEVGGGISRAVE